MKKTMWLLAISGLTMSLLTQCNQSEKKEQGKIDSTKAADEVVVSSKVKTLLDSLPSERFRIMRRIDSTEAKALHDLYRDKFRTVSGQINNLETEVVSFTLQDINELVDEMNKANPQATALKIYFGAYKDTYQGKPIVRKTVFFQPAYDNSSGIGSAYTPKFDDIPFGKASPHDVGHPCPPPKCDGASNY